MSVSIVPFAAEHLEESAALLAARHRRDPSWTPGLSPMNEHAAGTLPVLQDLLATDGTVGVVALRGGNVAGFLLGSPELRAPTHTFAGFRHPRSAKIPYAGHAVDLDDGAALYPRLYAALAQQWVAHGLVGHYIAVPATPDPAETWTDLGFGRFIAFAVRATTPPDERDTRRAVDLEIRRATVDDEETVQMVLTEQFRTFAESPTFVPFLPETAKARQQFVAGYLSDPGCHHWLAFVDGRLAGMQLVEEPTSDHWQQATLQTPPNAVYLYWAWTAPEARGTGIGSALFARVMAWAREADYVACTVDYLTASRAATFWRGFGFQPLSYWLRRVVDERATWANGRV